MDNWILVPCHNNSALLMAGLESMLAQTIPVRIFAINNESKDNTAFVLNTLGSKHVVVNYYPQLGVAGAWNYGLRELFLREDAKKVLVVNQDVILRPDTYEVLNSEPGGFVTAVSAHQFLDPLEYQRDSGYDKRPHPDFSCFRISRDCYREVGEFDENFYPAWFEDNDYHIRMAKAGIEAYCIDFFFYHYVAGTMKTATEHDKDHYYGPAFLESKQRFQDKWGVLPGTKQYENMCNPTNWDAGVYTSPVSCAL